MATEPVLLAAFGSTDFFRTAYRYDLDAIFGWLDSASKGETGGPRAQIAEVQVELKKALETIRSLSLPNGRYFRTSPGMTPDEHFRRNPDPAWANRGSSKFTLIWRPGFKRQDAKGAVVEVDYWSPYDLLGYFLSLLGPAPSNANRNNYFLPLTAVYARWSSKIAGHLENDVSGTHGAGDWPFMFNCTWYNETRPKMAGKYFGLGASLAGSQWLVNEVGRAWRGRVGQRRFQLFLKQPPQLVREGDWAAQNAPEQTDPDGNGTAWGNCAETYPFTEQLRSDKTLNKRNLFGIALMRHFLSYGDDQYNGYRDGKIWNNVWGPCRNCSELLARAGAHYPRFCKTWDKFDAPLTPSQAVSGEETAASQKQALIMTPDLAQQNRKAEVAVQT